MQGHTSAPRHVPSMPSYSVQWKRDSGQRGQACVRKWSARFCLDTNPHRHQLWRETVALHRGQALLRPPDGTVINLRQCADHSVQPTSLSTQISLLFIWEPCRVDDPGGWAGAKCLKKVHTIFRGSRGVQQQNLSMPTPNRPSLTSTSPSQCDLQ